MRPQILAVSKLPDPLLLSLEKNFIIHRQIHEAEPEKFASIAAHIRGAVVGGKFNLSNTLMSQLPALEIISVVGAGYDNVDVSTALKRGVVVTHTPTVHTGDVADFAMALLLSLGRQIPQADRFVREGRWRTSLMPFSSTISGSRLGVIGMGHVGCEIAKRACAFNMSVVYTARTEKPHLPYRFFRHATDMAAQVDFLVVAASGGLSTKHLIGREVLAALGSNGYLVNVARGSLIDQNALVDALMKRHIAGAALDVFDDEPDIDRQLMSMDNVILTPHIASATHQTRKAMFDLTLKSLLAYFDGGRPPHLIPECMAC